MLEDNSPKAAVVLIDTTRGILCAMNRKFGGWGLPGGKQESGETIVQTAMRELKEETGLEMELAEADVKYIAKSSTSDRLVYVFYPVDYDEEDLRPGQQEEDTPVQWLEMEELVAISPFSKFYSRMFAEIDCCEDDVNEARRRMHRNTQVENIVDLMERFLRILSNR